uniref:BHLH domain-containing protein n=1 Tax=Chaetoceros debilis TaxID=122233 RepID=A0A7S3Q2Z9_9STRA|eukprot:CAMPEP_0194084544 /NCGR_PEP_ID=MMETSP0149-20130528/13770_1 /TAXON_ID=122233 /ORGANISM="Chaetoceros debilis, Strain MM31A-1" /LENGTH=715 /DNA_ID=CAMNT_0038767223 /DNA_START=327 /DNA_END=2474 /DNA_ORIENTATION=+
MVTSGPPNEASGKPKGNTESSNPRNMNKTSRPGGGNSNSNSNGDNSGDNSDNSRFSLGNNSFGFNFDSEDGHSPSNSDAGAKSDEDASGGTTGTGTRGNNTSGGSSAKTSSSSSGGAKTSTASKLVGSSKSSKPQKMLAATAAMAQSGIGGAASAVVTTSLDGNTGAGGAGTNITASSSEVGSSTDTSSGTGSGSGAANQQTQTQTNGSSSSQHEAAAAATVAQLQTIAAASVADSSASASEVTVLSALEGPASQRLPIVPKPGTKRKASESVNSGYKSDDEASARSQSTEGSELKRKALSGGSKNVVGMKTQQAISMTMSHTHYGAVPSTSTTSASTSLGHPAANINPGMAMSAPPPTVANMSVNASPFPASTISMAPAVPKSSESVDGEKPGPGGKKALNYQKRIERNEREKERSYRITHQINELRNLLSTGGVIVPKGTKNAVLTEAANYIRLLQQHQYKSEIHRQQLIQQMQLIGSGQLGPQAANAIRHVAAKNGVWSLGNFGGVPPRSAMVPTNAAQQTQAGDAASAEQQNSQTQQADSSSKQDQLLRDIEDTDYRFVFNSCAIAMAVASMGGAFIDCNQLFIHLSEYTKQEICGLTIFNMTAREDLQNAFDLISRMISPPADNAVPQTPTCVLRGNMKNRTDLGLNITLIKDEEGIAKCFCVSLISNPGSPFDEGSPMHATAALIRSRNSGMSVEPKEENMSSPAFMTG